MSNPEKCKCLAVNRRVLNCSSQVLKLKALHVMGLSSLTSQISPGEVRLINTLKGTVGDFGGTLTAKEG